MLKKHTTPIQEAIQLALPASCSIYVKLNKKSWSGSGYHIGNGLICTASHVAPIDVESIKITFDKQNLYECHVLKSDPNIDAAVLKIIGEDFNFPSVVLANSDTVKTGDTIAILGAPEQWHDTVTVGVISNVNQSMGESSPSPAWNNIILTDAKILQGVSGGMVIDETGMVIGSVIGVAGILAQYGIGQNVICPSNKILKLIKTNV